MLLPSQRIRTRRGLTLIELVVVLLIIAALAGLAIPLVSGIGRSSDMAASAANQQELASNIEYFFVLQKRYPQGLDSLLDTTGGLYDSDTADANTQTKGLPYGGADGTRLEVQLTAGELTNVTGTAEYLRSFSRAGFDWVWDHDLAVINSNNSAAPQAADANKRLTSTSPFKVAEVTGTALIKKLLPGTNGILPTGTRLVALGVGPSNSAIGKTLTTSPIYPGCDGKYYGRFVAVFQVFASGERAVLVGVIDSYGRTSDYTIQQFNESLPNGGRQG